MDKDYQLLSVEFIKGEAFVYAESFAAPDKGAIRALPNAPLVVLIRAA